MRKGVPTQLAISLFCAFIACEDVQRRPLQKSDLGASVVWSPGGALTYIGPTAFSAFENRGAELLNAAYGGPLSIQIPGLQTPVQLVPAQLNLQRLDGNAGVKVTARFTSHMMTGLTHECISSWAPGEIDVDTTVHTNVDELGTVSLSAKNTLVSMFNNTYVSTAECSESTEADWIATYESALKNAVSDPSPLMTLVKSMLGGDYGFVMDVQRRLKIITAPTTSDSVSDSMIVRQNRIGFEYLGSSRLTGDAVDQQVAPTTVVPAPELDLSSQGADWAIAWRIDLLTQTVRALVDTGYFCRKDGLAYASKTEEPHGISAEEVSVPLPIALTGDEILGWSIRPTALPSVDIAPDGGITIEFSDVQLQLYAIRWGMPHIIDMRVTDLIFQDSTLAVEDEIVYLTNGAWTAIDGSFWSDLLTELTKRYQAKIPIGTVPTAFPLISSILNVSSTETHVIAWCGFSAQQPPILRQDKAAFPLNATDDVRIFEDESPSCMSESPIQASDISVLMLLALALTVLRWRVIVRKSKE